MESLNDKIVVLTGGAGGIGRALLQELSQAGARVVLFDLDPEALAAAAQTVSPTADTVAFDITDSDAAKAAITEVLARHGRIDVLINNAGISHRSRLDQTELSVIRKVMDVNFFGAVYCTHAALSALRASRGQIVAISSVAGFAPLVGRTGYSASKHALHGFFDTLRAELAGSGVTVLVVCPYYVASGMRGRILDGAGDSSGATDSDYRAMSPKQVARTIVIAMRRRRRMLLISPLAHLSWWVSRLAPRAYERLMRRATS